MTTQTKNIVEKTLTIKWLMQDDRIIKFEEVNDTFDISEKVAEFDFEKAGVVKGTKVDVKIDNDQGDHGMVVFMTKAKGATTNPSTSTPTGGGIVKTVKAYGTKYNGSLLFTDNENEWYSLDKSVSKENIADYKDKQIAITTRTGEKGGKYITSIKLVEGGSSQKSDEPKRKNSYGYNDTPEKQTSIEAQACVNHANLTVAQLFTGKFDPNNTDDAETIKRIIKGLAEHNFKVIQELKAQA